MLEPWLTQLGEMLDQPESPPLTWTQVHEAMERRRARVRLRLARLLGVEAHDGRVMEDAAVCVEDRPTRIMEDEAILARWRQSQGIAEEPGDVRTRLVQRLDDMARRCQSLTMGRCHEGEPDDA